MKPTVLIVEDTDLCRDALELALMSVDGVQLHLAETAEEALRELQQQRVCAIITDLHLASRKVSMVNSVMDGFELIAAVRANPAYVTLPILVTSGDSDPATAARLESLQVNAFFAKPYSPSAIRSKLEQLILVFGSGSVSGRISGKESYRGVHASHNSSAHALPAPPSPERKAD